MGEFFCFFLNTKQQILDSSKLTDLDENFKFDENGKEFSKRVENTEKKGKIARYEQFLLFPKCFQKTLLQTCKNTGLIGKELKRKTTAGLQH